MIRLRRISMRLLFCFIGCQYFLIDLLRGIVGGLIERGKVSQLETLPLLFLKLIGCVIH